MTSFRIGSRPVGGSAPCFVVAELSANHRHRLDEAKRLIAAAARAGADAVKLQTYTADTMTIDCRNPPFLVGEGTPWEGRTLYDLYEEAHTPWEWHAELQRVAGDEGLVFFSTPFDATAVEFLEGLEVPCHKVASFENADRPLLRRIGATKKPAILSTGMASLGEVEEAVETLRAAGTTDLALLRCTSAYPASPADAHLRTIPHLAETFGVVPGLSDHTLGHAVAVAAVVLGGKVVEKHFTLDRSRGGPDAGFSMEPAEFASMVRAIREAECALGEVSYGVTRSQQPSLVFRRSLFVVRDVKAGEEATPENVRIIRPGHGLAPRYLDDVLGRRFRKDCPRGTPLTWDLMA